MEPVTIEEMMRTCAIQAVRIEKLQDQVRNLAGVLEANNQQIIQMVEDKNKLVQELEATKCAGRCSSQCIMATADAEMTPLE